MKCACMRGAAPVVRVVQGVPLSVERCDLEDWVDRGRLGGGRRACVVHNALQLFHAGQPPVGPAPVIGAPGAKIELKVWCRCENGVMASAPEL